ncbi:MAG: hypothetical protein U1E46_11575 [Hyphomicrobiales bacterium]
MQKSHQTIASVCAVGALALGIIQTFNLADRVRPAPPAPAVEQSAVVPAPAPTPPAPASAAVAPATTNLTDVAKGDATIQAVSVAPSAPDIGPDTSRLKFSSGMADNAPLSIDAAAMFDGRMETGTKVVGKNGVDFIVEFAEPAAFTITGLQYTQPAGPGPRARSLEVMVIPETEGTAAGQQVLSFPLSTADGTQSLRIPPTAGKGLWLRLAGAPGDAEIDLGDLKVETAR